MIDHIFVDMDGVLADYYKADSSFSLFSFRQKVLDLGIFSNLERFEESYQLVENLYEWKQNNPKRQLSILSSCGVYNQEVFLSAKEQKTFWLDGFDDLSSWPRHFTKCGEEKAKFANPTSLLIDDTASNTHNFEWNGGHSLLWNPKKPLLSLSYLNQIISPIREVK